MECLMLDTPVGHFLGDVAEVEVIGREDGAVVLRWVYDGRSCELVFATATALGVLLYVGGQLLKRMERTNVDDGPG